MFQRKIPPDMLGLLLSWEPAFGCINWLSSRVTRFHGGQFFLGGEPRGKTRKKPTDHELPKPDIFTS